MGSSKMEIGEMVREEFNEQKRIEERKLNIMCLGIEESLSVNIETRKKDDEVAVSSILEEVLGDEEDYNLSKFVRIGQPIARENESDTLVSTQEGGNSVSQVIRKKIRPLRLTFANMENKKKVLDALKETINETKTGKYKYYFSNRTWLGNKERLRKQKEWPELQLKRPKTNREFREHKWALGIRCFQGTDRNQ